MEIQRQTCPTVSAPVRQQEAYLQTQRERVNTVPLYLLAILTDETRHCWVESVLVTDNPVHNGTFVEISELGISRPLE